MKKMNISKDGKTLYFSDEEIDSETNGEKKVFVTKRINGKESHVKAEKRKNIGKHLEDNIKQQEFEIGDDEIFSFNSEMVLGVNSSDEKEEKTVNRSDRCSGTSWCCGCGGICIAAGRCFDLSGKRRNSKSRTFRRLSGKRSGIL